MKQFILFTLLFSFLGFQNPTFAQVQKNVVVEHFTNSRCGICASRNPGFYQNLSNHPDILHIAYHPSSPYPTCIFNQHNKAENDARTNYYNIYGSTPKLVAQGSLISPSSNYSSPSIFTPFMDETTPISINIQQTKYGQDSISTQITLTAEASHTLGDLKLLVALAEDTIFYNSPNGESMHFDVFRKALTPITGLLVNAPTEMGESVSYNFSYPVHADWDFSRIFTMAILQEDANKEVVQAEAVSPDQNDVINSVQQQELLSAINIFPNPVTDLLQVEVKDQKNYKGIIYTMTGQMVMQKDFSGQTTFNMESLNAGTYFLEIGNEEAKAIKKIIVQ